MNFTRSYDKIVIIKANPLLTNKRGICPRGLPLVFTNSFYTNIRFIIKTYPLLFHKKGYASRLQPWFCADPLYKNMKSIIKANPLLFIRRDMRQGYSLVVEVTGLEPTASASRTQRSTKLSHTSILRNISSIPQKNDFVKGFSEKI